MKQIFIIFSTFVILSTFFVPKTYAVLGIGTQYPGISCGVAGGVKNQFFSDNPENCCTYKPVNILRTPTGGMMEKLPVLGPMLKSVNETMDSIDTLQKDMNNEPCIVGKPVYSGKTCICKEDPNAPTSANTIERLRLMCGAYMKTGKELTNCLTCVMQKGGMYTGMGCVPLNVQEFIGTFVFSWGIGIAGGISLLCIIYSAFMMQTSMGNPEAIKKAQENLTACITGLILIIFSVFILRLIGVSILRIPFLN